MKMLNKKKLFVLILTLLVVYSFLSVNKASAVTTTVNLATADNFAVLAGASIVDANLSSIIGDIGLSPASGSFIGVKCSEMTGIIYDNDAAYTGAGGGSTLCRTTNAGLLTGAKNDLTSAFTDAANRTPATTLPGSDNQLGGLTLTDGVYSFSGSASTANLIGTLTLNGQGNPNSVFILKSSSDFVTQSGSIVALTNGAQACNVFWQIPTSATLGTGSQFVGTIMADQSITDAGGSTVNGRFLARIASVTLDNTTISRPTCVAPTPTPSNSSSLASSNSSSGTGGAGAGPCIAVEITTIPTIITSRRVSPTSIAISWGPFAGLDTFNVRYGLTNGDWLYNTNVTGFSTTINDLPPNQPIWFQVAARNNCRIGTYGTPMLLGGTARLGSTNPILPDTGFEPNDKSSLKIMELSIVVVTFASLGLLLKKRAI